MHIKVLLEVITLSLKAQFLWPSFPALLERRGRGLLLGSDPLSLVMGMIMMHSGRMGPVSSLQIEGVTDSEVFGGFMEKPYAKKLCQCR